MTQAAEKMAELGVGVLPICGTDNRLKGMLTDRDLVVKVLAAGKGPGATRTGEVSHGDVVTIGADDGVEEIMRTMTGHKVRRLPVIDGHDLIGMVALAEVARALPNPRSASFWKPSSPTRTYRPVAMAGGGRADRRSVELSISLRAPSSSGGPVTDIAFWRILGYGS